MLLSGAFLLALVLLGVVVAVIGAARRRRSLGDRRPRPAARPLHQPRERARAGCSLPAGSQTVPASSPPPAQWGTVGSMQVPQNPAVFGPRALETARGRRALPTIPPGALLAAMNLWAEGTAVPPSELFAAAGGRRAEEPRQQRAAGFERPGPVRRLPLRLLHARRTLQVAIVFQGPGGEAARGRHLDGVATTATGSTLFPPGGTPAMQVIADLTGYVPWSSF